MEQAGKVEVATFAGLAVTDTGKIQRILDADPNLRLANHRPWPNQAKLAAEEQWAELKTLQDALTDGRS